MKTHSFICSTLLLCAITLPAQAGVALHCEEVTPNSEYLCDLFTSNGTTLQSSSWSAANPLFVTSQATAGATFRCGSNSSGEGQINVSWTTVDGPNGNASFGTNCDTRQPLQCPPGFECQSVR